MAAATQAHQPDSKALASLTNLVSTLTQQVKEQQTEISKLRNNLDRRNPGNNRKNNRPNNENYCWSHGWIVADNHDSKTCKNPLPGHQTAATRANTMGGSDKNKP